MHALIWWTQSRQTDIVPITILPKTKRAVGAVSKISWQDQKTKKVGKYEAKVCALRYDNTRSANHHQTDSLTWTQYHGANPQFSNTQHYSQQYVPVNPQYTMQQYPLYPPVHPQYTQQHL